MSYGRSSWEGAEDRALRGLRRDIKTGESGRNHRAEVIDSIEKEMRIGPYRLADNRERKEGHDNENVIAKLLKDFFQKVGIRAEVHLPHVREDQNKYTDIIVFLPEEGVLLSIDLTEDDHEDGLRKKLGSNYRPHSEKNLVALPASIRQKNAIPLVLGIDGKIARILRDKFYKAHHDRTINGLLSDPLIEASLLDLAEEAKFQSGDMEKFVSPDARSMAVKAEEFFDKLRLDLMETMRQQPGVGRLPDSFITRALKQPSLVLQG